MAHCEKYIKLKTHIPCINCNISSLPVGKIWQLLDFSSGLPLTSSDTCYGLSEQCGSVIAFPELYKLLASVFIEIRFKISLRGCAMQHCSTVRVICGNRGHGRAHTTYLSITNVKLSRFNVFQQRIQNCKFSCPIFKQADHSGRAV